jgi:hypothetical protein
MTRVRLPNRRPAETFEFEVAGLGYVCTIGRYKDGSVAELFISNHKSDSAADVGARGPELIRRALCRDSHGRASGPLGRALAILVEERP